MIKSKFLATGANLVSLILLSACGGGGNVPQRATSETQTSTMSKALAVTNSAPVGYTLVYQDNFDGASVNENDWFYRESGLYAGSYNRKENVTEAGGHLNVAFRKEDINGDGSTSEYTGGGVISKRNFGYGYYETRAKLIGGVKGFHQSFWTIGLPYGDTTTLGYETLVNAAVMPYYGRMIETDGFEQNSNAPSSVATNGHY